jgi:hypothetical protein
MYAIFNMCMWNKDGNKTEREKDKVEVRANKYSLHEWALRVHGMNQTLMLRGFDFCLLCCVVSSLRTYNRHIFLLTLKNVAFSMLLAGYI